MKSKLFICFLFLHFFCACNNDATDRSDTTATSENDVDAARNFIRSALDGKYDKVKALVVQDSANLGWVDLAAHNYMSRMSLEDKAGYRQASINIHDVRTLNDSTTIISYSNSFKRQNDSLKVVQVNGAWLVDLKYSFPATTTQMP